MSARKISSAVVAVLMLALIAAVPAQANQAISSFDVSTSTTQAGGHPDLETSLSLENPGQQEAVKNIVVNLPSGLFGNPNAAEKCSSLDFALEQCSLNSQVGFITVRADYEGKPDHLLGTAPVFDMQTQATGETARLAFIAPVANVPVNIPIFVRSTADYGLRMVVSGVSQAIPLTSADLVVWGFPADASHDKFRFSKGSPGAPAGCPGQATADCASAPNNSNPHGASVLVAPLVDNPTSCTGSPLSASIEVTTYHDESNPSRATAEYPATTGCGNETFNPVFNAALTTERTDTASGLEMQMKAAQFLGLANAPSTIRSASLTLPQGISINPDAADGQEACSDAQANFSSEGPSTCPDNSKIGNFDITTPALDGPLNGSLYFGEPQPGNQYRVFMIASGFGINAKIVASVHPDPETGQLTMTVDELPQVPFEAFNLQLFSSDRGLIATPTECGVYSADALFTPWNQSLAPQHSDTSISLTSGPNGGPCPGSIRPFDPRLAAGTSNPTAGDFSAFTLLLNRDDGDQFLGKLNFTMPPGLTADLHGVTYCPEASIAAAANTSGRTEQVDPSCPASSQIGTSNVAAGPGEHPFHTSGKIYFAGPFKGAPLSLVVITPALAGPYDYGTVVVRVALNIDPLDAHVIADSETVPEIIGGVPIRMRSIQVNIDKTNFMINPTNCSPFSVVSEGVGDQGTAVSFSSYFHVVNCFSLPFAPKMTIHQLGGHKGTKRGVDPSLSFDLRTRPGDANLKSVTVTLPNAFEVDPNHLANLCTEKELAKDHCAGRQPIGTITDETPQLEAPLTGAAYAVTGAGGLPHLAFVLGGQVEIVPRAETETISGERLRTTVPIIPDAQIGHFHFHLFGAKLGYLTNTRNLCANTPVIEVALNGQNGRSRVQRIKVKPACGASRHRVKRHHRR